MFEVLQLFCDEVTCAVDERDPVNLPEYQNGI